MQVAQSVIKVLLGGFFCYFPNGNTKSVHYFAGHESNWAGFSIVEWEIYIIGNLGVGIGVGL